MALSIVDLYRKILPRTNCGDCGFQTCLAFASMVVSEKLPLGNCPHLSADIVARAQAELDEQYARGKWTKRDPAADALQWARERASSMALGDIAGRIDGNLRDEKGILFLEIPYFKAKLRISAEGIRTEDNTPLNRWEQVFIYNHMAQGGKSLPAGKWKGLEEFPNTVSKLVSMRDRVETPLVNQFRGRKTELLQATLAVGGQQGAEGEWRADLALLFQPLPRVPVMLLFWDEISGESFEAKVKLLFDATVTEHLDIESILFLSERLCQMICEADEGARA